MKTEFIRFLTQDGVELQGLYFAPADRTAAKGVLHVHGFAGNFYENRFIDHLAKTLTEGGYAFLSFNNRGHDYLSDLLRKEDKGWTYVPGGRAHEIFAECLYDIDAALHFLEGRGVIEVCLQGHSSGANKVVFHQYHRKSRNVRALILLSPNDDIGLQEDARGDRFEEVLDIARALVKAGRGDELMPEGPSYPISANSYLDYFGSESSADVFPYRDPQAKFEEVSTLRCSLLILFAGSGEYLLGNLNETLALLRSKATASPRVDVGIIDGAPHDYLGRERDLSSAVVGWLHDVMPAE